MVYFFQVRGYQDAYLDGRASRASAEVPERARKTDNNLPQRVLFCLSLEHRLRKLAIRLQETQELNFFVNMVILFNFVVIALSPVGWGSVDNYLRVKRGFFDFVTAVLVLEMLARILEWQQRVRELLCHEHWRHLTARLA